MQGSVLLVLGQPTPQAEKLTRLRWHPAQPRQVEQLLADRRILKARNSFASWVRGPVGRQAGEAQRWRNPRRKDIGQSHREVRTDARFNQMADDGESAEPDVKKRAERGLPDRRSSMQRGSEEWESHRAAARTACSPVEWKKLEARKRSSVRTHSSASS